GAGTAGAGMTGKEERWVVTAGSDISEDAVRAGAGLDAGDAEVLGHELDDFADAERQAVGLGDARDGGIAEARAQQRRELAITVKALVVDLDDADVLVAGENLLEVREQGVNVADLEMADLYAPGL